MVLAAHPFRECDVPPLRVVRQHEPGPRQRGGHRHAVLAVLRVEGQVDVPPEGAHSLREGATVRGHHRVAPGLKVAEK